MTHVRRKYAKPRPRAARTPPRAPRDLSVPLEALAWTVGPAEAGARLDAFLVVRLPWRSRAGIAALIQAGHVRRDGAVVTRKAGALVRGERIEVDVPPPDEEARHEELGRALEGTIVLEDDDVLVLSKPPGLVVHPVGGTRVNTLIQGLHWLYQHGPRRGARLIPHVCHRLDRDTSGVFVLAKTVAARAALQTAFEGRAVEKDYDAVVAGAPAAERGTVELPIGPDDDAPRATMMTTRPDGLPACTRWEVVERLPGPHAWVRCRIETGRTHQIRVHMRALGHPVLLDPLYGDGQLVWPPSDPTTVPAPGPPVIARQALHARRCAFPHPRTGAWVEVEAPHPADLAGLLAGLRAGARTPGPDR